MRHLNLDKTISFEQHVQNLIGLKLSLQKQIKEQNRQLKYLEKDKNDLFAANRNLCLENKQLKAKINQLEGRFSNVRAIVNRANAA